MSSFAWWKKSEDRVLPVDTAIQDEKREMLKELAQVVVTFERRRDRVHKTATQALQSMREGRDQ